MRTLAIECATEACSIALFDGETVLDSAHKVLGRGHAEQLVPMIAALPDRGQAQRILVSLGPGSFTGVRIGVATAKALGFAWSAQVLGYPTLSLVAAMAMADFEWPALTVCMTGGHGEWFVQHFTGDGAAGPAVSLSPAAAEAQDRRLPLAGSQAPEFAALVGNREAHFLLPDASRANLLPPAILTPAVAPIYGRGPDARLPG